MSLTNAHTLCFALLINLLCFSSCTKEAFDFKEAKSYPEVAEELWPYFQLFETEAAKRGITIDLIADGITGNISEIADPAVSGQCFHNPTEPNHVMIDLTFWHRASDRMKELIIFHELGHCKLERGHRDEALPNGTCASIMRSGTGSCIDFYSENKRDYYMDELFENQ